MPVIDTNRVFDGYTDFSGGQDAGKRPNLIDANQYAAGENTVCRGGSIGTRPGLSKLDFVFLNNVYYDNDTGQLVPPDTTITDSMEGTQSAFLSGIFQGAQYFDQAFDFEDELIFVIGGRIFVVIPKIYSATVKELSLDYRNRRDIPIAYTVQADKYVIIQDGESIPIIYDGAVVRRAGDDEIFTGTIMAYGMGRIVLVGQNKRDIYFGDLYGSHLGDPGASVLKFTETTFLGEGGPASIPFSIGHIFGAIFYPQQDTTMGQGELLVFSEKGMASFFMSLPRDQWATSQFMRLGLLEIGGRGHRFFTPFNGDIWFRSTDGMRAYRQARAEAKGWFQLPLSTEVGNYLDADTENYLEYGSSIRINNRLISTCSPVPNQGKLYHNGLISLDFNVLSSFGQASPKPSWDGHWSGLKTQQLIEGMFQGEHRAFAVALDGSGTNTLHEINEQAVDDDGISITASFVSKGFTFRTPFNETRVYDGDLFFDRVRKDATTVKVWYKPDQYHSWVEWNMNLDPLYKIAETGSIAGIPVSSEGFWPRRALGKPPNAADSMTTKRDLKRGYEFQTKVEITGNANVRMFRLHGSTEVEKATAIPLGSGISNNAAPLPPIHP